MPTASALDFVSLESERAERRAHYRYPMNLQVHYRLIGNHRAQRLGFGRTIDVSSGGVLFEAEDLVPAESVIELALSWPFRLHGSCSLQLIVRGRILRADNGKVAVRSEFHEFRTARRAAFDEAAAFAGV